MIKDHFLINLCNRPDRLKSALEQLGNVGITPSVVTVSPPEDKGSFETIGQRGCYESHLRVLKWISGIECHDNTLFAIIEDDIVLKNNFAKHYPKIVEHFATCCELYDAYYLHNNCVLQEQEEAVLTDCNDQGGAHFYIVSKRSARKLYEALRLKLFCGTRNPYDVEIVLLGWPRARSSFTLAFQNGDLPSDISNSGPASYRIVNGVIP